MLGFALLENGHCRGSFAAEKRQHVDLSLRYVSSRVGVMVCDPAATFILLN